MAGVHWVLLFCSDERCTEVYEAWGPKGEFAALVCDCGVGLEMVGSPQPLEEEAGATPLVLLAAC